MTEYSPTGVQNTAATITKGISSPICLAVDGLGDIWVNNGAANITLYSQFGELVKTIPPPGSVDVLGRAAHEGWIAIGASNETLLFQTLPLPVNRRHEVYPDRCQSISLAFDANNDIYQGNIDGTIYFANPNRNGNPDLLLSEPFEPSGMVVDSARQRFYVSNSAGNQILVYSTSGVPLRTIQQHSSWRSSNQVGSTAQ